MFILGVSGKRGVGKNFLTENYIIPEIIKNLNNNFRYIVPYFFSFGSFVKSELYSRDNTDTLNYNNLFIDKTSQTRFIIQNYATENGRETFRKDMWIRCVDIWINIHLDSLKTVNQYLKTKIEPLFVIEDVRFENEYEYIKEKEGFLILVESPKRNLERILNETENMNQNIKHTHLSEKGLEYLDFDVKINNDPENSINVIFQIQTLIHNYFKNYKNKSRTIGIGRCLSFDSYYMETADKNEISEIIYHSFRH